jgi:isopenicillin N synthase-like dioxygenase
MENVYVADISKYLENENDEFVEELAKNVCLSFHKTGILIVKDPRVNFEANETFINQMEEYFNQSFEDKLKDARPDLAYQVGPTPEDTELPRDNTQLSETYKEGNEITQIKGKGNIFFIQFLDPKWRFFWRAGEAPKKTSFPELNAHYVNSTKI